MNFKTALALMKTGEAVKRRSWNYGYWRMTDNEIYIHEEDGTVTNLRDVKNMYGILLNIVSDDWEVILGSNKSINTDWDGDKLSKCDTPYSKQSELYKKAYSDYYKKAIERYKKEHQNTKPSDIIKNFNDSVISEYDKLQEEIRKQYNFPELNKNIKVVDKKYSGHLEDGKKTMSRMAKKYNLAEGKPREEVKEESELEQLERDLKERIDRLNAKNDKLNREKLDYHKAVDKLSSLPIENVISAKECNEAIKKCRNNIRFPKEDDCKKDYTKDIKKAAKEKRVIRNPKFVFLHDGEKKQETSDDRLKDAAKKTTEFTRVAPDVKPSNCYTDKDFKYLSKLFDCLYKDGTLEKVTTECLDQMYKDLVSINKTLSDILSDKRYEKVKEDNKDKSSKVEIK